MSFVVRRGRLGRLVSCASAIALLAAAPASLAQAPLWQNGPPASASQGVPREHLAVVEGAGGLYDGPVAAYVSQVGARVARAAGRSGCAFHVLNSDVVNAFTSPPGCHVYVTRGLLTLINTEDELASVLGHEVGHVAANHAGRRQQRSVVTGIGALVLGALTRSANVAQIASQAGQLSVLSYSRQQEFEADGLGVRYLAQGGYSPYGLVDMLGALQREDQFDAARRGRQGQETAAWARTHPLTGDRIARALQSARQAGPPPTDATAAAGRDAYLRQIDGMLYGDDPEQGFVEDRRFTHPVLRIGFEAPSGFTLTNGATAVGIEGPEGAKGQFSAGSLSGDLERYAYDVLRRTVGQAPAQLGASERTRIGGFDAVVLPARAQSGSRVLDVVVAAYADGSGRAYHFVTLSPAGRAQIWDPVIGSLHRLSPQELAAAQPKRVEVVVVRPGDTVQTLSQRMAFDDYRLERFLMINGLQPADPLRPGQPVKLVTTSRRGR
ncbi:M48 family metalloprotease [Phenylobacterium deserti]|nr:M48 family metalloprotease [Phenylobacterium deserti]